MGMTGMSWRARFRLLAGAYSVSAYGSYLNMVALNLFVYQVTGSVLGMGAFMAVRLTSGVVAQLGSGDDAACRP